MAGELLDLSAILTELVAAVAELADFSAVDDSVVAGWYEGPPGNAPFACVSAPEVSSSNDGRAELWARVSVFRVRAWRSFPAETQAARTVAALELADDVLMAIEDRYATSESLCQADDVVVRVASPGEVVADAAPDFVFSEFSVEVRYRRITGRGGV